MKKLYLLTILCMFLLINADLYAQQDKVRIRLSQPPPGMLNVDNMWSFTLVNLTNESQEVYLKGSATEEKDGLIATGQTVSITLKANETKNMKVSDLPQTPDINYLAKDPKYKESLIRQGRFPAGNYEICVNVIQQGTNEELGSDCIDQEVMETGLLSLVIPADGEEIDPNISPIFTWIGKPGDAYELRIVEIKGSESPETAMEKNKAFFQQKDIKSTTFTYPTSGKKFEAGKKYAWRVSSGGTVSEVWNIQIGKELPISMTTFCPGNRFVNGEFETLQDPLLHLMNTSNNIDNAIGWFPIWSGGGALADLYDATHSVNSNNSTPIPPSGNYASCWISTGAHNEREGMFGGLIHPPGLPAIVFNSGAYTFSFDMAPLAYVAGSPQVGIYGIFNPNNDIYSGSVTQNPYNPSSNIDLFGAGNTVLLGTIDIPSTTADLRQMRQYTVTFNTDNNFPINGITHILITNSDLRNQSCAYVAFDNFCMRVAEPEDVCEYSASIRQDTTINDCCGFITLNHPQTTTGVNSVQLLALDNNNTFISPMNVPGGWLQHTNNPNEYRIITIPPQTVPANTLTDIIKVCMSASTSPQRIAVNWLSNDSIICSDTVSLNCVVPCVDFGTTELTCVGDSVKVGFSFTNNSGFDISNVQLSAPTGVVINPTNISFSPVITNNSIGSSQFSLTNVTEGQVIGIPMTFTSPDGCCVCTDTLFVTIPGCVCNKVNVSLSQSGVECRFDVSLQNDFQPNYFTNVRLTALNGVTYSYFASSPPWYSITNLPTNVINLRKFTGDFTIPIGSSTNIITFVLDNYTTSTQEILVEWMLNDSVVCSDTIETYCPPPPPDSECGHLLNDTIKCNSDGTYSYEFYVQNDSTFMAQGFSINITSPYSNLIEFNSVPINFNPNPGHVQGPFSIPLTGNPGDEICYTLSLYQKDTIIDNNGDQIIRTGKCCHADSVCITLPSCPTTNCDYDVAIDSITCLQGDQRNVWVNINNPSSSTATLHTVTADNGIVTSSPGYIGPGNQLINISYTLSDLNADSTCFTFVIISKDQLDTCEITVCKELPDCTPSPCSCKGGKWSSKKVSFSGPSIKKDPFDDILNKDKAPKDKKEKKPIQYSTECGQSISLPSTGTYSVTLPGYICNPDDCKATYRWELIDNIGTVLNSGSGKPTSINFTNSGVQFLRYYPICGIDTCDPCEIKINVEKAPECDCGKWSSKKVTFSGPSIKKDPFDDLLNKDKAPKDKTVKKPLQYSTECGQNISLPSTGTYSVTLPGYICNPDDCKATYRWELINNIGTVLNSGTGKPTSINFTTSGVQFLRYYPICGTDTCDPCEIKINIEKAPECGCGQWDSILYSLNPGNSNIANCLDTIQIDSGAITFNYNYLCNLSNCIPIYNWSVTGPTSEMNSGQEFNYNFTQKGLYTVILTPNCDGIDCPPCTLFVNVKYGGTGNGFGSLYAGINNPEVSGTRASVWNWNGITWTELLNAPSGWPNNPHSPWYNNSNVTSITTSGSIVYAGINNPEVSGTRASVWNWNGITWTELLNAPSGWPNNPHSPWYNNSNVTSITTSGSIVYAGINNPEVSGTRASVWKWDGTTWTELLNAPSGWPNNPHSPWYNNSNVTSITTSGSIVYAGINNPEVSGTRASVWNWNGITWTELLNAPSGWPNNPHSPWYNNSNVTSITTSGSIVYAGINNPEVSGTRASVWKWDGTTWTELLNAPSGWPNNPHSPWYNNSNVTSITTSGSIVYAGINNPEVSGTRASVWKWDGTTWTELLNAPSGWPNNPHSPWYNNSNVTSITTSGSIVYAGINNPEVSGTRASVWKWDGTTWTELLNAPSGWPNNPHSPWYNNSNVTSITE